MSPLSRRTATSITWAVGLALLLVGGSGTTGCSSFSSAPPPVPDSTMRAVLVDLHIAHSRQDTRSSLPRGLTDSIFVHHGVTPTSFDKALHYYSRHPSKLASMYNGVVDTLNAIRRPNRPSTPNSQQHPDRAE